MEPQQTPGTNQQIDPTALALSRSIRQVESGGDYNAKGDNGQSWGAYQWNKDNFQNWAKQYGLDPTDTSSTNQDHLAYARIKDKLDQGLSQSQIAAEWNGAKMVNGQPQAINPDYVKKVQAEYEKQVGGESSNNGLGAFTPQQQTQTPTQPVQAQSEQSTQPQSDDKGFWGNLTSGNIGGAVGDVFNGAFPVVGDIAKDIQGKSDKSALQQLGDAGMSALWFLPFGDIAEGLGAGAEALGASKGLASAAGAIGTGLGAGYAGDVSSNLAQGKTGTSAATPGFGTLLGGGLAGAGLGAGAIYNKFLGEQNVVDRVTKAYEDAAGATKSGITGMSKTAAKGLDPNPEFLAHAGIAPETEEINGRRVFTTGADSASQKAIQSRISALSELRDQGIAQSGASINLEDLRQTMHDGVDQEFSGSQRESAHTLIDKEMDSIRRDPKYQVDGSGGVNGGSATQIKSYLQGLGDFDTATPAPTREIYNKMSKVAKTSIEDAADKAGAPSIKAINKLIQQHYDAQNFLNKINGQTVKGGRLGQYLYKGIGAAAGSGVANMMGGGLIGNIAGPILGEQAGGMVAKFMQNLAAGGPMAAGTLGRMAKEDPEIVQKFFGFLNNENARNVAPMVKPMAQTGGSLLGNFLKQYSITSLKK